MKLTLDLATSQLIQSAGYNLPVTTLRQSYGEGSRIEIHVVREGAQVTPVGPEEFAFVVKAQGKYDESAPILAGCSSFTWDASISRWVGEVNYNVAALTTQLFTATSHSDQADYLELSCQLIWRPNSSAGQQRTQVIKSFFVDNTIWKGSESFPSTGTPIEATSNPLFVPHGILITTAVVNNNATANTMADITDLKAPVQAGSWYHFRAVIRYSAAAITTGARFSINGPGFTSGDLSYRASMTLSATTQALNEGLTAYDQPAASNGSSLLAGNIAIVEGEIKTNVSGDLQLRFASEVSGSAITVQAGSCLIITRLNWP